MSSSRREFLATSLRAGLAWPGRHLLKPIARLSQRPRGLPMLPDARRGWRGLSSVGMQMANGRLPAISIRPPAIGQRETARPLAQRFSDLPQHFIYEYYPWYSMDPLYHWDYLDRNPPNDLSAEYVPFLGAYDSRAAKTLQQHAAWIVESGVGSVNLSWWGPGSFEDQTAPLVMDVMRDHGIKVSFHLEPYTDDHGYRYADDVLYLIRTYGDQRKWDTFLVLKNEDGSEGPVLKGFRSILPIDFTDCHGVTYPTSDYTPDDEWHRQTDTIRNALRGDFDHVTLLADSLAFPRTRAGGFDGIAIYDNFVPPASYAGYAQGASDAGLVFSFNVNAGYDGIDVRVVEPGSCYSGPLPFEPPTAAIDWTADTDKERAARASTSRIGASWNATMAVQTDPALTNVKRGFFLTYVTTFNEWHEGTAFEPMKDEAALSPAELPFGYHNPAHGDYRLNALTTLVQDALHPKADLAPLRAREVPRSIAGGGAIRYGR